MKTRILFPLPSSASKEAIKLVSIDKHETSASHFLFNGGPKDYRDKLFAIYVPCGNFAHCLCILWSEGEHTVLEDAVDASLLDSLQVEEFQPSKENLTQEEIEKEMTEWEESNDICRLGDAGEPFDITDVSIQAIPPSVWQSDWEFCHALGRVMENPEIETADDL